MTDRRFSLLVLGTADWDQPIATNQHYMTRELSSLPMSDVSFVESLALRSPELSRRDISRIARRLRGGAKAAPAKESSRRPVPEGTTVVSPIVAPAGWTRLSPFSRAMLRRKIAAWLNADSPRILWTYTPVTYGLEREADVSFYHCVDLLGQVPGISSALIDQHESGLAAAGAFAIGSSPVVVDHLRSVGFSDVISWPNVADTSVFRDAAVETEIADRRGHAIFAGNLTETKVDFALLRSVLDAGLKLHLAGPVSQGGGNAQAEVDALINAGAHYHGMLGLSELAQLYSTCGVGLIPYLQNSYTHGVSPLKTYEYLASGLAVVSTPIPAVAAEPNDVIVTDSREDFVAHAVRLSSELDDKTVARRRAIADAHSWSARGEQARELVVSKVGVTRGR